MTRGLLCLRVGLICLGVVVFLVPAEAWAQATFPCCEGGFRPLTQCEVDADCEGICEGGFEPGQNCDKNEDCKNTCVGGVKDGLPCAADDNCDGICVGGAEPGEQCKADNECDGICVGGPKSGDACEVVSDCDGFTCDPATCSPGACSDIGTCSPATCTGVCLRPPPKSPTEPTAQWLELPTSPVTDNAREMNPTLPCPGLWSLGSLRF